MSKENGLRLAAVISDGIRGHVNQSRGVASWLSKLEGAEVLELEIPRLEGFRRWNVRRRAAEIAKGGRAREAASRWLEFAGGADMAGQLERRLRELGIGDAPGASVIFISAGSMPAFYNLALSRIWGCPCATIMTPSVTGTGPFDFAIVPEHDYPRKAPNVITTLGAPNLIVKEELEAEGGALLREYPPERGRKWGLLVGGDDKNYRVTADWVCSVAGDLFRQAERCGADLYITTSRRTSRPAEDELKRLAAGCGNVRFMLIASSDPSNPVSAMLGACDEIFVTEDSVNMVSEAVTAGHRAVLLRVERAGALKRLLQTATRTMVSCGLLPPRALWGTPRFDRAFDSFRDMGLLVDFEDWIQQPGETNRQKSADFNEARRAAEWIDEILKEQAL